MRQRIRLGIGELTRKLKEAGVTSPSCGEDRLDTGMFYLTVIGGELVVSGMFLCAAVFLSLALAVH